MKRSESWRKDAVIREALGAQICERFISAKRLEWMTTAWKSRRGS